MTIVSGSDTVRRAPTSAGDAASLPRTASLGNAYLVTLLSSVAMLVLNLVTGVLSARLLAPDGRGAVGAIAGWAMIATVLSGLGFRQGMSWIESRDHRRGATVLTVTTVVTIALAGVGILVSVLFVPLGFSAQSAEVVGYAQISMIWILPYAAGWAFTSLFAARQRFTASNVMRVAQPALYAALLIALWSADRADVPSVLAAQIISFAVPAVIGFVVLARETGVGPFDREVARTGGSFGIKSFGSTFGFLANSRLDLIVLPAVVSPGDIGQYVVAVSAASMIVGLFGSLRTVVFPAAARVGGAEAVDMTLRATRTVLAASVAVAVPLALAAPVLVEFLYGEQFLESVTLLRLLLPGICLWGAAQIVLSGLNALNRPLAASVAQFVGVGITIIGLLLTLGPLGVNGAAMTSSASYAVVFLVGIWMFARSADRSVLACLSVRELWADIVWIRGRLGARRPTRGTARPAPAAPAAPSSPIASDTVRRVVGRSESVTAVHAAVALVLGLLSAWVLSGALGLERDLAVFAAAIPAGLLLGLVAVVRFEWFVLVVLAVRPTLDVFGTDGLGPGAMLATAFLAIAGIWLIVQRRSGAWRPLSPASRALLVFAVAVTVAVTTSQVVTVSAQSALEIYAGLAMFIVLEQLLRDRPDRVRRLIAAVLISGVVPVVVGLAQWVSGDTSTARSDVGRIQGTFAHPNPYATFLGLLILLVVTLALSAKSWGRLLLLIYLAALGTALVLTYNRAGWLAVIAGVFYIGYRRARWLVAALAVALVVVFAAVPSVRDRLSDLDGQDRYVPEGVPENSLQWRIEYWESLVMANDSPLTGIGPQVIVETRPERLEPHNVFVQTYVETGVLGLASLGAVVVAVGVTLSRRRRAAVSRFDYSLAVGAIAVALAMLIEAPSENLLNQTMSWWYFAACATWGFVRVARPTTPTVPAPVAEPRLTSRSEALASPPNTQRKETSWPTRSP